VRASSWLDGCLGRSSTDTYSTDIDSCQRRHHESSAWLVGRSRMIMHMTSPMPRATMTHDVADS
jgi:hypothetical protein